jgi:hypothetical protein
MATLRQHDTSDAQEVKNITAMNIEALRGPHEPKHY